MINSRIPVLSSVPFPSDEIDPKQKDQKWINQYARAIFANFTGSQRDVFYNAYERYREQRLYCKGNQSPDRYRKLKGQPKKGAPAGGSTSDRALDMRVFKMGPYYVNVATGLLSRAGFAPTCQPIDIFSLDEIDTLKVRTQVLMKQKEFLAGLGFGQQIPELEGLPRDENELELALSLNGKSRAAMKMEVLLQKDLDGSNFEQCMTEVDRDLVEVLAAVCKDDQLPNGKNTVNRIRPEDFLCGPSRYEDFRDCVYMASIKPMSLAQIKKIDSAKGEKKRQLTETIFRDLAQMVDRGSTNATNATDARYPGYNETTEYDQRMLNVMHFEFRSDNVAVFKVGQDPFGNMFVRNRPFDYNPAREKDVVEKVKENTPVIYEGYLIVNTEYTFGCGVQANMRLDPVSGLPMFSYHPYLPNTSCLGEQLPPSIDFIMSCRQKLHDHLAASVPKGYAYDMDAIDNIALKKGAEKMNAGDIIAFHRATGNYLYRGRDVMNKGDGPRASEGITEKENGMSGDVERLVGLIRNEIEMLERFTSLGGATSANDPRPEVGKATTEIAIEGTNNALQYLYKAKRMLFRSVCNSLVQRRKNQEELKKDGDPDIIRRDFMIRVDNLPTQDEWNKLYARAEKALAQKEITAGDMVKIERARTLAEAQMVFIVRERQNAEQAAAAAKQNQEATFQAQMEAPKETERAKQQTLQVESSLKMQESEQSFQNQLALQRERYAAEMALEDKRLASKEATAFLQNLMKGTIEERKIQSKEVQLTEKEAE